MYVWDRETLKHGLHDHPHFGCWTQETLSSHPMFLLPGKAPSWLFHDKWKTYTVQAEAKGVGDLKGESRDSGVRYLPFHFPPALRTETSFCLISFLPHL